MRFDYIRKVLVEKGISDKTLMMKLASRIGKNRELYCIAAPIEGQKAG